ncbi:hypothetical protein RJ492_005326 [Pluralibacter gergoviae]|uniref:Uncharacterized protein n=1 Tax=Pluralibacter gergoviae TaxID=61647 RepID=A0AAI9DMJ5_PLUGE|nr:hypothetical protein [Pluralibacter gergoviae]EKV9910524.1 hypothetical protein [Pluralibacter gergoviae]EKW7276529.1 hypothetical protein [Pluralibacter gergoviae]ELD4298454.1 hypothetical protein [Pluralibacter gergoviae]ELD4309228.1 hypothetical protein [Pluralibacter gergoviae]
MPYGFIVRNQYGAIVIDSEHRHTVFYDKRPATLTDVGAYDGKTPFGKIVELGFLNSNYWPGEGFLHWIRFSPGSWGLPGAWMFKPNGVEIIRTSRTQPIQSGNLNVRNGSGELIWSDISSYDMPRIKGFIHPTFDVDNNVQGLQPGFNPWILLNNIPGNLSDDGEGVMGYSGLFMRWDGATLQYKWQQQYQKSFRDTFSNREILNIPYATFNYGR